MGVIGIRVSSNEPPSVLLRPLAGLLDECWWYLGGAGVHLEGDQSPPLPEDHSDDGIRTWSSENAQWIDSQNRAAEEYGQWIDDSEVYRVGTPGWFSRYFDRVDSDNQYFACESDDGILPRDTLNQIDRIAAEGIDWGDTGMEWQLPANVVFACRDVDSAFWDFIARDTTLMTKLGEYLSTLPGVRAIRL